MTNDTSTLNGALTELGELMADNLVTMGVSDADASDGLTTLANKILDVPVSPVSQTLTLSSDKSILSYYDSDTLTLTATLTGGVVSGQTIEFFNGSTSLGTATTNSNGIATKTYSSSGVGDVIFSATKNSVSSNTITVEDCIYYNATQYTTTSTTLNIPLPNHFSLEYVLKQTNSSQSAPYLDIGDSTNNRMLIGQYARAGTNGLITYLSTTTNYPYSSNPTLNQENTIHFTYDGTDYTYWLNDLTPMTVSDKGVTLSKLIHIEGGYGGYLKDIKIKPFESINLVASQSILSYADEDSTVLTATHSMGTGRTVKLYDASDDSLIGTMTDNEDGTYSYTYTSQGIGDLNVYATDGNITSEDMLIEDCIIYDSLTSDNGIFVGTETPSYTSTGLYVANNGGHFAKMRLDHLLSQEISIEYEIVNVYGTQSPKIYTELIDTTDISQNGVQQNSLNTTGTVKMIISNNNVVTTLGQNTWTQSVSYTNYYWKWWTGGGRGFRIADLKIKAL